MLDSEKTNPDLFDTHISLAEDGTFVLDFEPWTKEKIEGIPSMHLARRIAHVANDAMRYYAESAMTEY